MSGKYLTITKRTLVLTTYKIYCQKRVVIIEFDVFVMTVFLLPPPVTVQHPGVEGRRGHHTQPVQDPYNFLQKHTQTS